MKCGTTRYGAVRCGITRYLRCGAVRYNTVRRASLPCRRLRPSVELVQTCRLAQDTTTFPFCFCCARYTGHKSLFILPQLGVGSAIHPPSLCVSVKSLFIARSLPVRVRFYTSNLDQRPTLFVPGRTTNGRLSRRPPPRPTPCRDQTRHHTLLVFTRDWMPQTHREHPPYVSPKNITKPSKRRQHPTQYLFIRGRFLCMHRGAELTLTLSAQPPAEKTLRCTPSI